MVGSPLSLPVQQRVEDTATRFAARAVVPADHVVRRADALEELLVHVLGAAVVGDVGQIHVDGGAGGSGGARLLRAWEKPQPFRNV